MMKINQTNKSKISILLWFIFFGFIFPNNNILIENNLFNTNIYYKDSNSIVTNNQNILYCYIILDNNISSINRMDRCYTKGDKWWVCSINGNFIPNYKDGEPMIFSSKSDLTYNELIYPRVNTDWYNIIENANIDLEVKDYQSAINKLNHVINVSQDIDLIGYCQYIIAEIYLNDFKNYEYSVFLLKDIIENYKSSKVSKKALFTLSYIYANHLDYFSDAIENYELFLKLYPNDELVPSVEYELNNLSSINQSINELSK